MSVSIAPFGKIMLTPTGGAAVTYDDDDLVFGQGMYRQFGVDVSATLQSASIERYRQSIKYEVTFETWGDDTAGLAATHKLNTAVVCYEDDGTTPLGTTFYGSVKATYNESTRTTSWTISGTSQVVPAT